MDGASVDGMRREGRIEDASTPGTAVSRDRPLDDVLALARALCEGLTRLSGPESEAHALRLARALSLDVVELIQDARRL
jgi:hypothetical protein